MQDKKTDFQKKLQKRDADIKKDFGKLMDEGYMKMKAYDVLKEKYGIYSNLAIINAIKRATAREDGNE